MVSEETKLSHVLEDAGIRAIETDLGEYIVQLAHQRPMHIVTPAIHMSAADVGHLFAEKLGNRSPKSIPR
jgi:L-lactate dehydrogenase complex protein LldF